MKAKIIKKHLSLIPRFLKRKVIQLSLILALASNPALAQTDSYVLGWVKSHPKSTAVIQREYNKDGIVYIVVERMDRDSMIDMKTNPIDYEIYYADDEFVCNSLKEFFRRGKPNQVAIEVDLRSGKVITFFDTEGNDLLKILKPIKKKGTPIRGMFLHEYMDYYVLVDPKSRSPVDLKPAEYLVFPTKKDAERWKISKEAKRKFRFKPEILENLVPVKIVWYTLRELKYYK